MLHHFQNLLNFPLKIKAWEPKITLDFISSNIKSVAQQPLSLPSSFSLRITKIHKFLISRLICQNERAFLECFYGLNNKFSLSAFEDSARTYRIEKNIPLRGFHSNQRFLCLSFYEKTHPENFCIRIAYLLSKMAMRLRKFIYFCRLKAVFIDFEQSFSSFA